MILSHSHPSSLRWPVFVFLLAGFISSAPAEGFHTVQRKINSYNRGEITYTCLAIDGGVVPLIVPAGAQLSNDGWVELEWAQDHSAATFRPASPDEIALFEIMDKPEAPDAWKKYLASTFHVTPDACVLRDFQPDILAVNHWRIGAISVDHTLGAVKISRLLLLWRCLDGATLAVTLRSDADHFNAHRDELYAMIGGAMILKK